MSYRGLGQNGNGAAVSFEVVIEGERQSYPSMAQALDVAAMSARGAAAPATVVSPPGSDNVMAQIGPAGESRMVFAERQNEYDQIVQELDETAQEIGAQLQQEARAVQAQTATTPTPILALGIGAIVGGLLTRGRVLGFVGGATAGYFLDKAIRQ